jgi:uncharacterized protein (DUF2141 family)
MKRLLSVWLSAVCVFTCIVFAISGTGCANMIPPTGGPRDSLPPELIAAIPRDSATNYTGDRVTLTFNEYVNIENALENILISPTPINTPLISNKLRNITVRLRDTLEPNTTYSINFGNAIKDVNEGNVFKNFTYVFSTGSRLDENTLSGKVVLAETGKVDSTLLAVLHRNLDDSAVAKERPRFITRLDGKGNFQFRNLPGGIYALYAIPNEYSRHYDDTTKPFAFASQPIHLDSNYENVVLNAFSKVKKETSKKGGAPAQPASKDKQLRFSANLQGETFDILDTLHLDFNRPITAYDSSKISLTDADFKPIPNYQIVADTNKTRFTIYYIWPLNTTYNLLLGKEAFADSAGITLPRNDTLTITTKKEQDYGSLKIRFNNLDLTSSPVLQVVQNDVVVTSSPLTQREWFRKLFKPGTYQLRLLFDTDKNGKWDTGEFFGVHRQPELVRDLNIQIEVRANWDNEKDISL